VFSKPEVVFQIVFPVLLHYPELSSTRRARYETAMKTGNAAGYLYDFYRKRRRGLAQAPIEREAESQPVSFLLELVLTGFLSVDRRSQTSLERGNRKNCVGVRS